MNTGQGSDRLVPQVIFIFSQLFPHLLIFKVVMQGSDTLAYIDEFNMEPLLTSQLQVKTLM